MKNINTLPNFEKIENYINYRSIWWETWELTFDLQLIYFKRFLIIKESLSENILYKIYTNQINYGLYEFWEHQPVIVPREWFDLVHPIDNCIEKAKRFFHGDLYLSWTRKKLPLFNFLDFLTSCNFEINANEEKTLQNLLNILFSENPKNFKIYEKETRKRLYESMPKNFHNLKKDQESICKGLHYNDYLDLLEYQEFYLKFLKLIMSIDYILKISENSIPYEELWLILTLDEILQKDEEDRERNHEEDQEKDYAFLEQQIEDDFAHRAFLVHEGELGPNDPDYPF
ncbi:MAG: hypothetical protein DCF12_15520 [Snowella sp.]|nr:MAG: hypothetical protein DCF12_15520 [Snowella sp.]